jgi:SAM-dependent methyltransferase
MRGLVSRVLDPAVRKPYLRLRGTIGELLFERRYGVRTEERLSPHELGLHDPQMSGYMPYGWSRLRRAMPRREVNADDVFLDVGSGMGRVVLQAALHYPFRRVLGIEISAGLHEAALMNLAANASRLRCHVDLQHGNALDFEIPDDVTVVFMYNPFAGNMFQRFIDRILESVDRNPRRIQLVYANPREHDRLIATGRVQLVRSLRGWRPSPSWSRSNSTRLYVILP